MVFVALVLALVPATSSLLMPTLSVVEDFPNAGDPHDGPLYGCISLSHITPSRECDDPSCCHAGRTGCHMGVTGCHTSHLTGVMGCHTSYERDAPSCSSSRSSSGSLCGSPSSHSSFDSLLESWPCDRSLWSCDSLRSWGSNSGFSRSHSRVPHDRSRSSSKDHSFGDAVRALLTFSAPLTEATHRGPQSHPLEVHDSDCHALLPPHKRVSAWYHFA